MSRCLNCQAEITTAGCDCRKVIWGGGMSSGKRAFVENLEEIKKAISEAKGKFDNEITLKHYKYDNGFCACGRMLQKFESCKELERRELFKQVALQTIRMGSGGIRAAMLMEFDWNAKEAARITEEILKSAAEFGEGKE